MAADIIEFPDRYLEYDSSLKTYFSHRSFSPDRPEVSFLAL
jgi:hypothetical protein